MYLSIVEAPMSTILKPVVRKLSYMAGNWWGRIEARLAVVEKNQSGLARHIKAKAATVSAWKSGTTHGPKPGHLIAAAEFLKTTEKWLWQGSDPRCDAEGNLMYDRASLLDADSIAMGEAFQVMPPDLKPTFQKTAHTFAQSAQLTAQLEDLSKPWDQVTERRQGGGKP